MIKVRVDRGDIWLECDGDLIDIRKMVTGMLSDPQSVTWDTDEDTTDTWLVNMAELKRQMEEE